VQFTHIMDFMILMPLGPQLMRELALSPRRFSALVAAYTLSAGIVGLFAAPFLDRFDRRTALLATYTGFGVGTFACGWVHSWFGLLLARALCGGFGGVSGALVLAIVGDLVPPQRRASAMGVIMTAFSFAAALGVPFGLFLSHRFYWEAPFLFLGGLSTVVWGFIFWWLPPVRGHLNREGTSGGIGAALRRFTGLLEDPNAGRALLFMASLVFAHFVIIPLMPEHLVHNLGVREDQLFLIYLVGGLLSAVTGPLVGRWADAWGRVRVYGVLVAVAATVTVLISNSGPLPSLLNSIEAIPLSISGISFISSNSDPMDPG
jgi:predicted MFS family arabinose efflux permease